MSQNYGDKIAFTKPYWQSNSLIVYPLYLTLEQIVAKIQNYNLAKSAGEMIRASLQDVDFGLKGAGGSEVTFRVFDVSDRGECQLPVGFYRMKKYCS